MRIKDFAGIIGVSPTTISHAINGSGRVSPATRDMVRRRMAELGYVPNPHAQQLVTGRSRIVALHHTSQDILSDLFLIELARGIEEALRERGYGLLLDTASDLDDGGNPLPGWLASRAIDGIILIQGWSPVRDWVQRFASPQTPVVVYGSGDEAGLAHVGSVTLDMVSGFRHVAQHLVGLGHRRIGYIGLQGQDGGADILRQELASLGCDLPSERVVCAGFTPADGARALRGLMALASPPNAVFCRKDDLAVGALSAAAGLGVRVPGRLSLVGHDDVPLAAVLDPPLTSVQIGFGEMAHALTGLLFRLLEQPDCIVEPVQIPIRLVVRGSTAPVPAPGG